MSRDSLTNKDWLNASSLRAILSVSMLAIIAISGFGFAYAHQTLSNYADEIARKKVDASSSNSTIASLQKIQQTMEDKQDLISKIDRLRSESSFPEFAVVDQIKALAKQNDIKISDYSFDSSSEASGASNGQVQQPSATGQPVAGQALPSGDTVTLKVSFSSVPSYRKYLQFLSDIEQNVPKIHIKGVGVSGGSGSGSNFTVDPLVVEMYKK